MGVQVTGDNLVLDVTSQVCICKVSNLFVIARNSSFAYKGKSISVKQIAQELGVRYILEGSVQKAGERVRITAQLIDATTDYHMWSENYDRGLKDVFALQDDITLKIIYAMRMKLTRGEQALLWEGGTQNIQAFDLAMRGTECFFRGNEKDNKQARKYFKEAISIDRKYVSPHALLGFTHLFDLIHGWSESPIHSFEQAKKNTDQALSLNESFDIVHILLGWIYLYEKQHDKAILEGQRAIDLNPNGAEAHAALSFILCMSDKTESAINLLMRAIRLNPIPPSHFYTFLAIAYRNTGEHEKAIESAKKSLSGNRDQLMPYLTLAASYVALSRTAEAHRSVKQILRLSPNFSLDYYAKMNPHKNQESLDRYIEALRKAGLPD